MIKLPQKLLKFTLILATSTLLLACGGGDDSDTDTAKTGDSDGGIIGTAKIIVKNDSKVETKTKSGQKTLTSINAKGKYHIATTTQETYLIRTPKAKSSKIIKAIKSKNTNEDSYIYSIAHHSDNTITRNLHPFTDLIIRNWFATRQLDINNEFNSNQPISQLPSVADISAIETEIEGIVANVLIDHGINQSIDLIAKPFDLNGQGFDKFLDNTTVVINNDSNITIVFKQASGNAVNVSVNLLNLATNLTSNNDTPPTTPSNLKAYPQSASSIVLRWKVSTDDKGVSGYHIYRNGNKIATTAYPVYTDTGLTSAQNYRYQVQAIDGRNQTSAKTTQTVPTTPSANANIPLDGSYDVVVTSISTPSYCSGATGSLTLTNEQDITGSVTSDTNSNYVFALTGQRDKNTGAITGGLATTSGQSSGIQYATIDGVIDSISSNGTYSDIRGCKGVWVATKQ